MPYRVDAGSAPTGRGGRDFSATRVAALSMLSSMS